MGGWQKTSTLDAITKDLLFLYLKSKTVIVSVDTLKYNGNHVMRVSFLKIKMRCYTTFLKKFSSTTKDQVIKYA